jgi:hypothetical protein
MAALSYALMTRPFAAVDLALLPREGPARRRRHQRRQRDAGGLPRGFDTLGEITVLGIVG